MSDMLNSNAINNQQHGRGVAEPWSEWFAVVGGASSVKIVHYRAIRVRRVTDLDLVDNLLTTEIVDIGSEFPVWLVWSEQQWPSISYWYFEGSMHNLPEGVRYLTYSAAHTEHVSRLRQWVESCALSLDIAKKALSDARSRREHDCTTMPAIGKIGTFDISGARHAEAEVQEQS
jgi:hypothetical protein